MSLDKQSASERHTLRALQENSQFLNTTLDLDFVLNNLLLSALSKLFVTKGAVWLRDGEVEGDSACVFEPAVNKGFRKGQIQPVQLEVSSMPGKTLVGAEVPAPLASVGVHLVAPIASDKKLIGFLALAKKATDKDFQETEIEFLESLVNISAAAIRNSIVVDDLRNANTQLDSKVQQLNTLFDIGREFNSTLDRNHVAKLLSFALMGQMAVGRYAFLFRSAGQREDETRVVMSAVFDTSTLDEKKELIFDIVAKGGEQNGNPLAALEEIGLENVELAIPLRHHGLDVGVLLLGPKLTKAEYEPEDTEFVTALGNLAVTSIRNSFLVEQQIEKELLEEEMRLAREIQERLQPETPPPFDGLDIAMLAIPSRHVAGDYVDIVTLDRNRLLLAIGDVTGKGLPASLLMSNLQAALHVLVPMPLSLEESTSHINRVICENTDISRFATYFHCIYSGDTKELDFVNAGHNPPYLVKRNGDVLELDKGGLLLGVMPNATYERGSVALESGDTLCMFTDGITEAMSPDQQEYDEVRLLAVLQRTRQLPADQIMAEIRSDLAAHTCGREAASDDVTIVVMKVI